ncbi:hypothetical protein DPMN_140976 [Dreissena polymorpha]|uniref:Uncharacterized protein n=1 Tax=Dreissena polymorpha TaxID=45954 RepID=A0A9D4JH59_DREPO|nr:hypothetical protein DPMN_140976 [Dreissena polymorpha]
MSPHACVSPLSQLRAAVSPLLPACHGCQSQCLLLPSLSLLLTSLTLLLLPYVKSK